MTIVEARALFNPAAGLAYLDSATYGLPPQPTIDAMNWALLGWQDGTANWINDWDSAGDMARELFARLIGAQPNEIALVPTASVGVATIAASLGAGDHAVVPADEFTSVLFPLLAAQQQRDVIVRQVPFDEGASSIDDQTTLIATSLIRSQDGRMADLPAILAAADKRGSAVLIDATHAVPFVDLRQFVPHIDYLVCHGYKHLLCPRGAAFLYVRRDHWDEVPALHANWRAADQPYGRSYGGPLTLAPTAARFDVSLDWFAWVGARASLELLVEWQREGHLQHPLDLARDLAQRLELPAPAATIIAVPVDDPQAVMTKLAAAKIKAAAPGGLIRLSTHVYTTPTDIARAVSLLAPLVDRRS